MQIKLRTKIINPSELELLTDGKMELGATDTAGSGIVVEAPAPVDPQQSEHGQEGPYAHPCGTFGIEGIELVDAVPGVPAFQEDQTKDGERSGHGFWYSGRPGGTPRALLPLKG
mgnify:CR=1 FL=1